MSIASYQKNRNGFVGGKELQINNLINPCIISALVPNNPTFTIDLSDLVKTTLAVVFVFAKSSNDHFMSKFENIKDTGYMKNNGRKEMNM